VDGLDRLNSLGQSVRVSVSTVSGMSVTSLESRRGRLPPDAGQRALGAAPQCRDPRPGGRRVFLLPRRQL